MESDLSILSNDIYIASLIPLFSLFPSLPLFLPLSLCPTLSPSVGTHSVLPSFPPSPRLVISELQAMLNAVGGPSNIKSNDPNNPYPGLTNFSLLSHGFGYPANNTRLSVVQTYLQELLAFYDSQKPVSLRVDMQCLVEIKCTDQCQMG